LEDLSDASFLGNLLALPANVRLDWKVIAKYKHTSLFGLVISNEGKKFYSIDTRLVSVPTHLTSSKENDVGTGPYLEQQSADRAPRGNPS